MFQRKRVNTPSILQMEAVECGAAALGMILAYYGRIVPLEELRARCGISRDGSRASNIIKAARQYGMTAKGFRKEIDSLKAETMPVIIFWKFNHFVVLEGFGRRWVYINDPASGQRKVTHEEFDKAYTGITLTFEPNDDFERGGQRDRVLPSLWRRLAGSRLAIAYIMLAGLGVVFTGVIIPSFSRVFVDEILIRGEEWIIPLLLGMLITAALRGMFTWFQQYHILRTEAKLALKSSSEVVLHILSLPMEFFYQRYAGEISSRVALNDLVARRLSTEISTTILSLPLIVFFLVIMFQYDVLLTLVGIGIALVNLVVLRLLARQRIDSNQRLLQENGKLFGVTLNGLLLIETLKAGGLEGDFFSQWAGHQAKALNAQQDLGRTDLILSVVPVFLGALNTGVILIVGGLRVIDGALTIGMLVAFQSLMASFLAPVNQFVTINRTVQEVDTSLRRLNDVLRYEPDPHAQLGAEAEPVRNEGKLTGHLELVNLTYGYSRLGDPLIEDFNLVLQPGQRVALVGSSGSGKSTVAKLVAGLYQPWSGEILYDGLPRGAHSPAKLVSSIGMVDQDILLFQGSIRENLTLWDRTIPEVDIVQAAKDAAIHDAISQRQGGYNALVDEDGRNFSGGQRQRLELARALVTNPTLLILDEATSALDPITEQSIDRNLRRRGCSVLIVAHRLSTIRDSDEIIVMEQGRIVERGSHTELMQQDGAYTRLLASEEYETSRSQLDAILGTIVE
ncbi:MAG: NHLP family bacteriocin export ABC transporter peptidase/permease/ATPase subunit [Chloroflexi bacterium]|nr:NHLP family bacteriocin export ABC transporter peptidase/permease/ATPase subunit [Chloroflexota bacterium]